MMGFCIVLLLCPLPKRAEPALQCLCPSDFRLLIHCAMQQPSHRTIRQLELHRPWSHHHRHQGLLQRMLYWWSGLHRIDETLELLSASLLEMVMFSTSHCTKCIPRSPAFPQHGHESVAVGSILVRCMSHSCCIFMQRTRILWCSAFSAGAIPDQSTVLSVSSSHSLRSLKYSLISFDACASASVSLTLLVILTPPIISNALSLG